MNAASPEQRVFSGLQPSGSLHLGNYLGAIRQFVALQQRYQCLYCAVDLHAITVRQDPKTLAGQTRAVAAACIAAGVDPDRHPLFVQSHVPAHVELAWILNCTARIGWLGRMTQFKDKAGKDREQASVGLYAYPVLMAADILAYRATHVPVGDDQKQHLELVRDIAGKFNADFSDQGAAEFFPLPEPLILAPAARVMSLRDGRKKMSKSDPSDMSRILMSDSADAIARKIRKARTDSHPLPDDVAALAARPEAANLVGIFSALADQEAAVTLERFGGGTFSVFKEALAELAVAHLAPVTAEMVRLRGDPGYLDGVLARGREQAAALSAPVLRRVREFVGFAARPSDGV